MACSWLKGSVRHAALLVPAALLTMLSGSCLITTDPEPTPEPAQTPPVLVADQADPDPRGILQISKSTGDPKFVAFVQSEDAGEDLQVFLLLDYGIDRENGADGVGGAPGTGKPFARAASHTAIPASTWLKQDDPLTTVVEEDEPNLRRVDAPLTLELDMSPGCHRLTLMVAHSFSGDDGCPPPGDYDAITWTVYKCDPNLACPLPFDLSSCPPVEDSCQF